jgi:hypothetical protein
MKKIFFLLLALFFASFCHSQVTNDFRSVVATGNWNALASWERYNGSTWVAATVLPGATANNGNVTIQDGHTITVTAAPTAAISSLTVGQGVSGTAQLNVGAFAITITGATNIATNGTLQITGTAGVKTFTGAFTNNGTWNNSGNSAITFSNNITNNGTFTSGTGVYTLGTTASATINGTFTFGSLTVSAAKINNATLTTTTFTNTAALTNNASFTVNGTHSTSTASAFTNSATGTYTNTSNLSITTPGTFINNGTATISGATFGGTGGFTQGANATLYWTTTAAGPTTLTAAAAGNTVIYNNTTAAQSVKAATYLNLTINKSGQTATSAGAVVVNGNLNVTAGTFATAAQALTVSGTTTIPTGSTITHSTGTKAFTGDITIDGTWTEVGAAVVNMAGNLTINGTYTALTGVHTFSGATKTLWGSLSSISIPSMTVTGTLTNNIPTLTVGTALAGAGTLTMGANTLLNIGGTSAITSLNCTANTPNTVVYTGAAAQTIKATTYYHLEVNKPGGTAATGAAYAANILINGNLTVTAGYMTDAAAATATLSGGTFTVADGAVYETIKTTGNFFPVGYGSYTFNTSGGFEYGCAANLLIPTSPTTTYGKLIVSGGAFTKTLQATTTVNSLEITIGTLADGGFEIVGPGSGSGTFSIGPTGSVSAFTLTYNPGSTSGMPLFQNYVFHATNSTVNYNSTAARVVSSLPVYGNLSLGAGASAVVDPLDGNTTVMNTLSVAGNNTLDVAGYTLSFASSNPITFLTTTSLLDASSNASSTLKFIGSGSLQQTVALTTARLVGGKVYNFEVANTGTSLTRLTGSSVQVNNLSILSGAILDVNSLTMSVYDTYSNGGSITALSASGTLELNGTSSAQTISLGNSTGSPYVRLKINNANGVTLTGPALIGGLDLISGILNTDNTNLLTIYTASGALGTVTGASSSNYVNGPVARQFNGAFVTTGTFVFPVGTGGDYTPLEIIDPKTGATAVVVAKVFNTTAGGTNGIGFSSVPNPPRYWEADVLSGSLTSAGTIQFTDPDMTITTANAVGYSTSQTGSYMSLGGTLVSASTIKTATTVPLSLGFFKIGEKGCISGPGYTVGASGDFKNLTDVAAALNGSIVCANLTFELLSDYDGTVSNVTNPESFPITFNPLTYSGGPWNITIRPGAGVTGRETSGVPVGSLTSLILINGADRIIFDGRPGGSGSSEWSLKNTLAASVGPTITFTNDSQNDTLRYLSVIGSNTQTTQGVVLISPGVSTGNDNIVISNCNITRNGSLNPTRLFYSLGLSAAVANDNITISNNDFSNFTTYAIDITNTGNGNNWIITNNNIFSGTTTATAGINITSATSNNFLIDNNKIGGTAINCGGSAWSVGAFNGINLTLGTTTPSTITNNIIQNFTSTGSFIGINIVGGSMSIGNGAGTGNIIGHATTANSIGMTGTTNTFRGIQIGGTGNVNVTDNLVGNINHAVTSTGTAIAIANTSTGTINILRNKIYRISSGSTATSNTIVGIQNTATTGTFNISNNLIKSLNSTNTTIAVVLSGISFVGTNAANSISGNIINSFRTASSSASSITTGILTTGVLATTTNINNNIIRLGIDSSGTALTSNMIIRGMDIGSLGTTNVYHNSVYIGGGSVASSTATTAAYYRSAASGTHSVRNNIFSNSRINSSGTAVHYAMHVPTIAGHTSNYNLYQATIASGGQIANYGGTNYTTYQALRAFGQDANSGIGSPNFVNATGAATAFSLKLQGTTPAEGSGDPSLAGTITVDFEGDDRTLAGNTPVDMGADAGGYAASDIFAPQISYTTIATPTIITTPMPLDDVTILDGANGTATIDSALVWYRNSTTSSNWVSAVGTFDGTYWDFIIDYAALTPAGLQANVANTIQYYVVAEDVAGNVWFSPAAATTPVHTNANIQTTAPAAPNTYVIQPVLSGTVTVGSSGADFQTLTNAGGLFATINSGQLGGDLTVNIITDLTTENGATGLNQWVESGIGGYTLTIQNVNTTTKVISGSYDGATAAANGLIRFTGADNVTINGGTGTQRLLTIRNTFTGLATWVSALAFNNSSSNNTVNNVIIEAGAPNASNFSGVVYFGAAAAGTGNDNNTVTASTIRDLTTATSYPRFGVYSVGTSAAISNDNNTINDCDIFNFYANGVTTAGVWINDNNTNWQLTNNDIYQAVSRATTVAAGTNYAGIRIENTTVGTVAANNTGHVITGNKIGGSGRSTAGNITGSWAETGISAIANRFRGIVVAQATGTAASVQGNQISRIAFSTSSGANTIFGPFAGIHIVSGNANVGTTTGNIIGAATGQDSIVATISTAGGISFGIANASTGVVSIENNTIGAITLLGNGTTVSHGFTAIAATGGSPLNINTNTIGSTTTTRSVRCNTNQTVSAAGTAQHLTGISVTGSAGNIVNINNNTISNLYNNAGGATTSGQTRGILVAGAAANSINNNTIAALESEAVTTGNGTLAPVIGIAHTGSGTSQVINNNTIHSLQTNVTSSQSNMIGILWSVSASLTNTISNNKIHSFISSNTINTSEQSGIYVAANFGGVFHNNIIRLGIKADGSSTAGSNILMGIQDLSSGTCNYYYNTVLIAGTCSGASTANTYAYRRTSATGTKDIRNNIFANNRTGGLSGSTHYAFATNTLAGYLAANFDYNIYQSQTNNEFSINNGTSALAGTTAALRLQNLRGNTTAGVFGNNLHSGIGTMGQINFIDDAGDAANINLRLNNITSAANAAIAISGITTDAYGNPRSGTQSIGAHEGSSFVAINVTDNTDIYTPIVTANPISNQSAACGNTVSIPVSATVTDFGTGVNNTSYPPTLWWRLSGGTWASIPASAYSGNVYDFTLNISGLSTGQTYEYYVVAQDKATAQNVWYSSYTSTTPSHDNVSAAGNPYGSGISTFATNSTVPLSGTVAVGGTIVGGETLGVNFFNTLTGGTANDLFFAMASKGISSDLTVLIRSNITEAGTTSLTPWQEYCGTGYKVRIKPETTGEKVLSGSHIGIALVKISGADRVIIDGRYAGTGNFLTFRNTYISSPTGQVAGSLYFDFECIGDSVLYANIEGRSKHSQGGALMLNTSGNTSISVKNCNITDITASGVNGYPNNCIYSAGSGTFEIDNCNLRNFSIFSGGSGTACGLNVTSSLSNTSTWTFSNNSIYTTFIDGTGPQKAIDFRPGGTAKIDMTGNYIGGSAPLCAGANFMSNNTYNDFIIVDLNVGTSRWSNITNNTIKRIEVQTGDGAGVTTIQLNTGKVKFYGNTIGGFDDAYSITSGGQPFGTFYTGWVYGIYSTSSDSIIVDNNSFISLAARGAFRSYGNGIEHNGSGTAVIRNNTIANCYNGGNESGLNFYAIALTSAKSNNIISGNNIYNIGNLSDDPVSGNQVSGIVVQGTNHGGTIEQNKISNLFHEGNGGESHGIVFAGTGNWVVKNNQLNMINRSSSGTFTTRKIFFGLHDMMTGGSMKVYNNTILVHGGQTGAAGFDYPSACYYRLPNGTGVPAGASVELRNNILVNARTGNPTANSIHYALDNTGNNAATGWSSNYNFISAPVSASTAYWGTGTGDKTFATWKTASGGDASSWSVLSSTSSSSNTQVYPADLFVNTTTNDLNINPNHEAAWFVNGKGVAGLSGISNDYAGNSRGTTYGYGIDIGANEFTPTVNPHTLTPSVASNVSTFNFAGRTIGSITWSASSPPSVEMQYFSGEGPGDSPAPTYTSANKSDFVYHLEPTSSLGSHTFSVEMNYDDALLGSFVSSESVMKAIKSDVSTAWLDVDDGAINTTQNRLKSLSGLSTFSYWGGGEGTTPLPIELLHFNATCDNDGVLVGWSTATETNNDFFTVQRSSNLLDYVTVGVVEGAGNSNIVRNYSFKDESATNGTVYYRLMQTDYNGQYEVFNPIAVTCSNMPVDVVSVYPNPANDVLNVNINLSGDDHGTLAVLNSFGQVVTTQTINAGKGFNNYTLDVSGLAAGQYFVSVSLDTKVLPTQKLVITK